MKKYVLISLCALTAVSAEASVFQFFKQCVSKVRFTSLFRKPKASIQITELTSPAELATKKDLVIWHDTMPSERRDRYPDVIWTDGKFYAGLQSSARITYVPLSTSYESGLKQRSVVMQQMKQRLYKDY